MPVIPTDFQVGASPFQAGGIRAEASPAAFAQPGEATAQAGEAVAQQGAQFAARYAEATRQKQASDLTFQALSEIQDSAFHWSQHPNAAEAETGFNADVSKIRNGIEGANLDPEVQELALNQINRHAMWLGLSTQRQAFGQEANAHRATVLNQLLGQGGYADQAAAQDPTSRAATLDAATASVKGAVAAGWMYPEAGEELLERFHRTVGLKTDKATGDAAARAALLALPPGSGLGAAAAAAGTPQPGLGAAAAAAGTPQPGLTDAQVDAALAPIAARESGGRVYVGYAPPGQPPVDLSHAPLDATGFPIWPGNPDPNGISHAAGLWQIQPETWRPIAEKLGIHDFSEASQTAVARELYREQGAAPWAASAGAGQEADLAQLFGRIDRMGLSPQAAAIAREQVRVNYSALQADRLRQQSAQKRAQAAAVKGAMDQVIADAYGPDPKITPQQIADDPRFAGDPEARLRMIQVVRNAAGGGLPSPAASHEEALALLDRVRRPDGDPQKITTVDPIYDALIGNKISRADFDFVRKEYDQIRTPDGEVLGKRKADFLKAVAPTIDKSNPLMGKVDNSGKQQLYAFQWQLDQKIDEYRKADKNPADLLDPSKPDYMGSPAALAPYQRTLQQSLHDQVNRLGAAPASPAPGPTAPVPSASPRGAVPRNPGETPAEYLRRIGAALPMPPPPPHPPIAQP